MAGQTPKLLLLHLLLLPALLAWSAQAAGGPRKLPSYLRQCSIKDPQLNACALKNGRAALPTFVKGDASLRIAPLDPLLIPEVRVQQGSPPTALDMTSRNIIINGLADTHLESVEIDVKNQVYEATCKIPRLEMLGDYEVNGQILVLPVRGNGKSNFTFENVTLRYTQPYTLEKKNDYLYMRSSPSKANFDCDLAHFQLDNLFNGDPTLGSTVNTYLNENWRTVVDELSEPFIDTTARVIRGFVDAVTSNVPYDNIFLDTK